MKSLNKVAIAIAAIAVVCIAALSVGARRTSKTEALQYMVVEPQVFLLCYSLY